MPSRPAQHSAAQVTVSPTSDALSNLVESVAVGLIATNRDFMWNHKVQGAAFQRIDGGEPDDRWKNAPGALWTALVPYDATLRKVFEANHDPASWGGLAATPWYVARESGKLPAGG